MDVVRIADDVLSSEVKVSRSGNDIVLSIANTTDKLLLKSVLLNDGANDYVIGQVKFADGTTWDMAALKALLITGTDNADTLIGFASDDNIDAAGGNDKVYGQDGNDYLIGGDGDDYLYGRNGNDFISGGAGKDYLYGENGDDVLDGGVGNDYLNGGVGNDTYQWGRGSGQDILSDVDSTIGNTDQLSIGEDVASDQLWFRHVGANLEVSVIGTADKMTISGWYNTANNHIEQFVTSDGKALLDSQIDSLVSAMAAFSPPAAGQTSLPPDYQTALNPVLSANWK